MVVLFSDATIPSSLEVLATHYGPIAFGAIMLLAVWRQIVKPELDSNRAKTEELRKIAELMSASAITMNSTAITMSSVVTRLENMQNTDSAKV